ncbi:hypothetical protein EKO29_02085 [Colwellia sp. Arc7-635]|uniref:hypothetical protein n=1 Tax=Colwellia sp. Arc7-635 TaxID=2497879 RepID=UPI000F855CE1|nr:hypothetical protein [Colwellia sp. Arc7-635]AZQ82954.1 hypothetical protein EKO29_02085 [Colwellia sp. Arc7-635]
MNNFDKVYFKSKVVGKLSSQSLSELKSTLQDIESGKKKLKIKIASATNIFKSAESQLNWINWFPLKLLFKEKILLKKQTILSFKDDLNALIVDYEKHQLGLDISLTDRLEAAFGTLDDKFSEIMSTKKIWDVTTSQRVDRVIERTTANNTIERKSVALKRSDISKILCDYKALHFENANGGDLNFFPQFIFIENNNDFALVDILDIDVHYTLVSFIESEGVPSDTEVVDHTWAKANKNGDRDKRFADNYQIPVVEYGELHFKSKSGINEVYMFSNPEPVIAFKKMFDEYKQVLANT